MSGSSTVGSNGGQSGVYGTAGTPAPGNTPGGRYGAARWTDSSGQFWLFGGLGYDADGGSGYLNDLWVFNPSTGAWAWMNGSNTVGGHGGQPGVYGTLGAPAAGNTPGSRAFPATWTDRYGNLWLFGGWDYDANAIAGELNDLWMFNPSTNQWAWMGGSSTVGRNDGQSGVYGTLGTPAPGNTPGGLFAPSGWTDDAGHFWLFGGQGYDANGNFHELNGLWAFNPSTSEWAWMGGSKTVESESDVPGVYGTLGTASAVNFPGNRSDASSNSIGGADFWLFAGQGYDSTGAGGYLNDLWEFDSASGEWTWISGSSSVGSNGAQSGAYGQLGMLAAGNVPGGRSNGTSWTDENGNLLVFGGYGVDGGGNFGYLNDLWEFNAASGDWAWMGGSSTVGASGGQPGVYGMLGTRTAQKIPGGRDGASGWIDGNGSLWLFGGYGYDANGDLGSLNDLWAYQWSQASLPAAATPVFSPAAGAYASAQSVTISDSTPGATLYYTTDGTQPTVSSTVYTGAIPIGSTETLLAMAIASGYVASAVAAANYIIAIPAAATPVFSPGAGTYMSAQSVTISDSTPGATVYYTTDGTTPTSSSAVYSGAITVASTETLQAIATASGDAMSAVASAAYVIDLPASSFNLSGTALSIAPGAASGNISTIIITPVGGFTGSVALSAALTTSPPNAQYPPIFSFGSSSPVGITAPSAGTATLTVITTAPSSAALVDPAHGRGRGTVIGGAALACVLLFCIPTRRRRRNLLGVAALFGCLAGGVAGCGTSITRTTVNSSPGTTPGAYTVTITGTSGAITETGTIALTVQ